MSETVRSFDRGSRPVRRKRSRGPRTGGGGGKFLFPIILIGLCVYVFWTTRDTYPMGRLIPRDQEFRIFAADLLGKRAKVASSSVWGALPKSWELAETPKHLTQDFDMPEWVLNNTIGPMCQISGNDSQHLSDLLFVTRMRRIGCLVERVHRWSPSVARDRAGGLNLLWIESAGLYYAVRGRILAVSPSRDALVRSLTLREEDALDEKTLDEAAAVGEANDLHGVITFPSDAVPTPAPDASEETAPLARLAQVFATLDFAVHVEAAQASIRCRGALQPAWKERMAGLLADAEPCPLMTPPDGLIMVSANFGKPVQAVWDGLAGLFEDPEPWRAQWEEWAAAATGEEGAAALMAQFLTTVLEPMGPGMRLSWRGVDLNEMAPVPELVGVFDADADRVAAAFQALPPVPPEAMPWDTFPRYDAEAKRAWLPMPGGPSLEPTAIVEGDSLLVSTSRTVADALAAQPEPAQRIETPANLFVRVKPGECVQAWHDVGALLAEDDLLKGYTPESFEEAVASWRERTGRVEEVSALFAWADGEVSGQVDLVCQETPATPAPASAE